MGVFDFAISIRLLKK